MKIGRSTALQLSQKQHLGTCTDKSADIACRCRSTPDVQTAPNYRSHSVNAFKGEKSEWDLGHAGHNL